MPEHYEASISALENTKDLSKITLAELLHALQAYDQRRLMRQNGFIEGVLPIKHQDARNGKKSFKKNQASSSESSTSNQAQSKGKNPKKNYPLC